MTTVKSVLNSHGDLYADLPKSDLDIVSGHAMAERSCPRATYAGMVRTDEWMHEEPEEPRRIPEPDFAWGRTANPNTADGELQNIAAFSAGLSRLSGPRRTAAVVVVWLILAGFALAIAFGVIGIFKL